MAKAFGWLSQAGCGELSEAFVELEHEGGAGEGSQRHGGIALLQAPEGAAADEEPVGHVRRGDAAPAPREGEIVPELTQGSDDGQRQGGHFRHGFSVS